MSSQGSEMFATLIAVVHKTKVAHLLGTYEKLIPWTNDSFAAVPRSAKSLEIEDKEGNQLWRVIVMREKVEDYII